MAERKSSLSAEIGLLLPVLLEKVQADNLV
jgi:hypothetical protein